MPSRQTAIEYATDQLQQGNITADQANVMAVQIEGVRVICGKVPSSVRKALNAAVKAGELGHIKKEGLKPEVYHHKNARANALEERERVFRRAIESIKGVFA
ncbi:hypothetical protein AAHN97_15185 [Chitinophaga niabensis]|uniref:hypothetical protein n=1 Tax=Chitinophaga niabensis TaxID=536979 RepID=UPI0031BA71E8